MRIAMLHPSLTWRGGAERQVLVFATELQRMGHDVEIFTCALNEKCYPEYVKQLKINVVHNPIIRNNQNTIRKRTVIRRLKGRVQGYIEEFPLMLYLGKKVSKNFDIINNHNTPTQWAAFFAKRNSNLPIVWMCNEPPFWFSDSRMRKGLGKINTPLYQGFDKFTVKNIDKIVTISFIGRSRIEKAYGRSAEIVRPGIDVELFHRASGEKVKERYKLENDFVLLQVGNIARDKRQTDTILALHDLCKKHDNVKLILVGQGPTEDLVALSRKLGVENKVLFLKNCSDDELAQIYAACDVFVFPAEITWGLAVIEAMASSKAVVVSKKAGASEIIKNGENGFIIDEPYSKNIVTQIEKLMSNPYLCQKIGANAYQYTLENLSWEKYAKNMESVFIKTIKNFHQIN
ncbi:MAG: glycosyltransferase family 4 protein [Candidatus Bathyarchaeota archaeon]|nr:glycosyltransferase family 4 protein [Candidatus Bathyarchaeota archaeon]MDD4325024.1 glycosyltransferase family 4 protein [Candidatus Bathyarchaeota archaeon]MDI9578977.1 glycosyltransferase family 4 protein [Thermoproteota archaeon]MDT8781821.1 glycosyltransferase family 4 protein [Candidatus Bathyarchaeota archaeon]NLD66979.1 glycosyltransferase family 4 protein [Thermoproteota archaeon]